MGRSMEEGKDSLCFGGRFIVGMAGAGAGGDSARQTTVSAVVVVVAVVDGLGKEGANTSKRKSAEARRQKGGASGEGSSVLAGSGNFRFQFSGGAVSGGGMAGGGGGMAGGGRVVGVAEGRIQSAAGHLQGWLYRLGPRSSSSRRLLHYYSLLFALNIIRGQWAQWTVGKFCCLPIMCSFSHCEIH